MYMQREVFLSVCISPTSLVRYMYIKHTVSVCLFNCFNSIVFLYLTSLYKRVLYDSNTTRHYPDVNTMKQCYTNLALYIIR